MGGDGLVTAARKLDGGPRSTTPCLPLTAHLPTLPPSLSPFSLRPLYALPSLSCLSCLSPLSPIPQAEADRRGVHQLPSFQGLYAVQERAAGTQQMRQGVCVKGGRVQGAGKEVDAWAEGLRGRSCQTACSACLS